MQICGIVSEYNPYHNGHARQFRLVRQALGPDTGIVCLMSGNFVQRGMPAIFDKSCRAAAAIAGGADLVLELPIPYALSSAEGFADGAVGILSPFCDYLSFGAEKTENLMETASLLLQPEFPVHLHTYLAQGLSFPAARAKALFDMGGILEFTAPNTILGVEYCKAILKRGGNTKILPILRGGDYHDPIPQQEEPSATAIRILIEENRDYSAFIPAESLSCFQGKAIHRLQNGEKAILYKLRTMDEEAFASVPFGSEGLWRKFLHASRIASTLEGLITEVKSKRYTRTRLDRFLMCAFLGITEAQRSVPASYSRVLAFNEHGREILRIAKKTGFFPNAGEKTADPYEDLEIRSDALYALFSDNPEEAPDAHRRRRVIFLQNEK